MANTTLNTVIKLRYDSYENWQANSTVVLQAGEAGICNVPASSGTGLNEPATLMKIGNGTSTWADLPWISGLAADVIPSLKGSSPTLPVESVTGLDDYLASHGAIDTDTQYQIVKEGDMGIKLQSKAKGAGEWTDVVTVTLTPPVDTLVEGSANGTVAFNGEDVAVHGLKSAAYTESSAYDAAGAASAVQTALVGTAGDPSSANTINAAKKFATESIDTAMGTLNLNAVTAGTGQVIGQIQQTDGAVTAQLKTLTVDDIPAIPTSKVTNLDTTLAGKQDTIVFNTTYNADTNKAATMQDITTAVSGLSGAMHYVGESTTDPSTGTATVEGHEDWVAGDVVTYNAKEYVYDGENWRELGDEASYAIKGSITNSDIAAGAAIDQSKIANLVTDLAAKATPADITNAIQALDVASQAVTTGNKITAIEQVDGKIAITTGAITSEDIPELAQTKITGLTTALAGKQDALTMDGTYNAESNKVATQSTVTNAIGALDFDDTAVAHQFITEVNENNGVISVQRAALTSEDIPNLTASKITDLDTTISGAIDEAITTDGAINEAISGAVTEAIAGVAGTVAAVENNFVTSISMANGVLTGTVAQPTIANINGLQTALDAKANTSSLGYFATGTNATKLTLDTGDYLILNGGGAAGF